MRGRSSLSVGLHTDHDGRQHCNTQCCVHEESREHDQQRECSACNLVATRPWTLMQGEDPARVRNVSTIAMMKAGRPKGLDGDALTFDSAPVTANMNVDSTERTITTGKRRAPVEWRNPVPGSVPTW